MHVYSELPDTGQTTIGGILLETSQCDLDNFAHNVGRFDLRVPLATRTTSGAYRTEPCPP